MAAVTAALGVTDDDAVIEDDTVGAAVTEDDTVATAVMEGVAAGDSDADGVTAGVPVCDPVANADGVHDRVAAAVTDDDGDGLTVGDGVGCRYRLPQQVTAPVALAAQLDAAPADTHDTPAGRADAGGTVHCPCALLPTHATLPF